MSYCENCGKQTPDVAQFCRHCGTQTKEQASISKSISSSSVTNSTLAMDGGIVTQIENLNIKGVTEQQFTQLSGQLNLILEKVGIPKEIEPEEKISITKEQKAVVEAVEEKFAEAEQQLGRPVGDPDAFIRLGNTESLTGNPKKALELYNKALKIYEHEGDENGVSTCFNQIGLIYDLWGDYDRALDHYQKALKIFEELGAQSETATLLSNIGTIYTARSVYNRALSYYQKALKIFEELGARSKTATLLINIGMIY